MKTTAILVGACLCAGNFITHWIFGASMDDAIERSFFQCAAIFAHTVALQHLNRKT